MSEGIIVSIYQGSGLPPKITLIDSPSHVFFELLFARYLYPYYKKEEYDSYIELKITYHTLTYLYLRVLCVRKNSQV